MDTTLFRHTVCHRVRRRLAVLALAGAIAPATAAEAQTPPAKPPRWDVSLVAGYLAVRPEIDLTDRYADRWYDAGQAALTVGRYFTPHLKGEVELSTSTEGRQWIRQYANVPGLPFQVPYGSEQFSMLREVSVAVAYQFFENQWVHPFVFAGVAADFDRVRSETERQLYAVGDPRLTHPVVLTDEIHQGPETTTHARMVFGGGGKFFTTQRVFVRADGRYVAGEGSHHLALRIGVGFDF
jgi:hypothetical protein